MIRKSRGFTLVEILIVVIILGILAAIVIPQFTDASTEAKNSSTSSTLQSVRSQIELFKVQHVDAVPTLVSEKDGTKAWAVMLGYTGQNDITTAATGTTKTTAKPYGPYFQQPPVNTLANNTNGVMVADTDPTASTDAKGYGWVYNSKSGQIWAVGKNGAPLNTPDTLSSSSSATTGG